MEDCIFCDIVNGKESCYEVFSDEFVLAFLDINPFTKGHTLLIPKEHIIRLDMVTSQNLLCRIMDSIVTVSNMLIHSGLCDDFSLICDNGPLALQEIDHFHFHLIPRNKEDDFSIHMKTNELLKRKENLEETLSIVLETHHSHLDCSKNSSLNMI